MPRIDIWGQPAGKGAGGIWDRGIEGAKSDIAKIISATIHVNRATINVARGTINFSGVSGIPGFTRAGMAGMGAGAAMGVAQDERRSADYLKRLYGLQYGRDPNFVGTYGPQTMASIAKNIKMLNQRVGMHPAGPASLTPWAENEEAQRRRSRMHGMGRRVLSMAGIGGIAEGLGAVGEVGAVAAPLLAPIVAPAVVGVAARMAMKAVEVFSPSFISAGLWSQAMNAAAPYLNLRIGAAALGRAGGFSSRALGAALLPGGGTTPQWMQTLGLGGGDVLSAIQGLGIVPRSGGQALNAARVIGTLRNISPSFAGLPPGAISGMLSQGLGYGLTGFGGLGGYAGSIKPTMDAARRSDADRLKLLQSIESTLREMAHSGAMIGGIGNLSQFYARMMGVGTPAARTGALQAGIISGVGGVMAHPFGSPLTSMLALSVSSRYGGFRTEASIDRFLGPGVAAQMKARSPALYHRFIDMITHEPNQALRSFATLQMARGDVTAMQHMIDASRATFERMGMSPVVAAQAAASAAGLSLNQYLSYRAAPTGGAAGLPTAPGNIPHAALAAKAKSQEAQLYQGRTAMNTFIPVVNTAQTALSGLSRAIDTVKSAFNALGAAAAGAAAGAPGPMNPYSAAQ